MNCDLCLLPAPRLRKRVITKHGQPCVGRVCPDCDEAEKVAA